MKKSELLAAAATALLASSVAFAAPLSFKKADANADGLTRTARRLGEPKAYSDYRKMLDEVKPDLVSVAPRWIDEHCDMVVAAAERGVRGRAGRLGVEEGGDGQRGDGEAQRPEGQRERQLRDLAGLGRDHGEEQGEAQLRATSDGSKAYVIWHSQISDEEDPDVPYTRYYPWKPSGSSENDLWFRRLIFWPDAVDPVDSEAP